MGAIAFLEILFPTITFDRPCEMSLSEVRYHLSIHLSTSQMRQIRHVDAYYDVENLRSYLAGGAMTAVGTVERPQLQEMLIAGDCPIVGLEGFFHDYPTFELKKSHLHELILHFLKARAHGPASLAQQHYLFEYRLRHLLALWRSRKNERHYPKDSEELEILFEDEDILTLVEKSSLPLPAQESGWNSGKSSYDSTKTDGSALHRSSPETLSKREVRFLNQERNAYDSALKPSISNNANGNPDYRSLLCSLDRVHHDPIQIDDAIMRWKLQYYESLEESCQPLRFEKIFIFYLKMRLLESRKQAKHAQLASCVERMAKAVQ